MQGQVHRIETMMKPYDTLFVDLLPHRASMHGMSVVWSFGIFCRVHKQNAENPCIISNTVVIGAAIPTMSDQCHGNTASNLLIVLNI